MIRSRHATLELVALYLTLSILFASHTQASSQTRFDLATQKLVLADYLNQWSSPQMGWDGWYWNGCGATHDPTKLLANGNRDIASAYYPLIGPYDAGDEAVIEYHIRLAQAAGIDAFVVEWDGIKGFHDFHAINSRFVQLLRIAERLDFGVAILYDAYRYYIGSTTKPQSGLMPNRPEVLQAVHDDLAFVLKEYGPSPSYLRFNGKPVIFSGYGIDSLKPSEWAHVFQTLQSEGLEGYYVSQGDQSTLSYYPYYQGFSPWLSAGAVIRGETTPVDFILKQSITIKDFAGNVSSGVSAWPGFNDSPVQGWCTHTRYIDRGGGRLYNETWIAAINVRPTWIYVITFNDWNEGTIVEPSTQFGYQYLYATAYYSALFKHQTPNYEGIPVPLAIYNATLALRQAQVEGRMVGFDSANQTLTMAEQAFLAGQYASSLTYANQAHQLANEATSPSVSTTNSAATGATISSEELSNAQAFLSRLPEWYWLFLSSIMVAAVVVIIAVRRRK